MLSGMSVAVRYDIVGDVHGRFDKLEALMTHLGYKRKGKGFVPPDGRRALFLGDLIDPKPGHTLPVVARAVFSVRPEVLFCLKGLRRESVSLILIYWIYVRNLRTCAFG